MQPVGSKASFPFRSSASEVPAKQPINAGTRGASVLERRQKFCEPAVCLDRLVNLRWRSNGLEGQIEPELKRHGPI